MWRWAAIIALVAGASCSRGEGDGGVATDASGQKPPPEPEWNDYKLKLRGMSADASFSMTAEREEPPLHIKAFFNQFPKNTEITLGDARQLLDDRGHWAVNVDVRNEVGAMSAADVFGKKVALGVTFSIHIPGYQKLEAPVPEQRLDAALREALVRSRGVGLAFDGEPAPRPKAATAVVLDSSSELRRIGPIERIWDIDWVAIEERDKAPARTKKCSGYDNGALDIDLFASTVSIHERRTGKAVEEKKFEASDRCPSFAAVTPGRKSTQFVSKEDIDRWVRGKLGR
jgi:hypothetical protein